MEFIVMTRTLLIFIFISLIFLPISVTGCGGGKKTAAKKDYGKPVWLTVDESKFSKLSEDATDLENGTVTVYDPEGWERLSRGSVKAPKGFKSVIVFKKSGATIIMTKSQDAKGLPDLDEENIEEFADGAQQKFKSPVKMVKLGDKVGVYFSRRVADAQRLSKYYDRRIVATTINGGLFTYELIADQGRINETLQNALFAVISKTQFENSATQENAEEDVVKETKITETKIKETKTEETKSAADTAPKQVVAETSVTDTIPKPVAAEISATETVAAKPAVAETVVTETKDKPERQPEPVEVAAVQPAVAEKSAEKSVAKTPSDTKLVAELDTSAKKPDPDEKKPVTKKPAAKKPAKKGNTKDILNELDALLN
jgi:hypothetical protein